MSKKFSDNVKFVVRARDELRTVIYNAIRVCANLEVLDMKELAERADSIVSDAKMLSELLSEKEHTMLSVVDCMDSVMSSKEPDGVEDDKLSDDVPGVDNPEFRTVVTKVTLRKKRSVADDARCHFTVGKTYRTGRFKLVDTEGLQFTVMSRTLGDNGPRLIIKLGEGPRSIMVYPTISVSTFYKGRATELVAFDFSGCEYFASSTFLVDDGE